MEEVRTLCEKILQLNLENPNYNSQKR
uniref:Uncharacterized protein n=1 Tax=Anguilla anguilla TaxID=7936 RepID=A0A0E9S253_ANGAN